MIINFFCSFIGSVFLEVSNYTEILNATTSGATEAELMAVMMDNMGGLAILFLYFIFLIGGIIAGTIIFFGNKKKFRLTAGEMTIEKGQRFKTIILNLGVILYSIFWIVQIILQLAA